MPQDEQNISQGESEEESVFTGRKKLIIIVVAVLVVIALGVGAYMYFTSGGDTNTVANGNTNTLTNENSASGVAAPYSFSIKKETGDTDRDGLKDEEEKKIGTDPKKADTDSDGLSDYEENNIYKSNPKKPDTDNDGFLDGEEVRQGFDPNGSGKLLDTIKAIEESKNTN